MFTGIIEDKGTVSCIEVSEQQMVLHIKTSFSDLALGESVAVNGVCLTVNAKETEGIAQFYVSPETLSCTALGNLHSGSSVNLERALKADMRLSGHIVQGHVDTTAEFVQLIPQSDSHELRFLIDNNWNRYCLEKGSIAIDGISLTINSIQPCKDDSFTISIMIIPHTWQATNLSHLNIGDSVNIEVDILGKYMEKLCAHHLQTLNVPSKP
jgi:riboflavin synthase